MKNRLILFLTTALLIFAAACGSAPEETVAPTETVPMEESETAEEMESEDAAAETSVEETEMTAETAEESAAAGELTVFTISQEGSAVRFELDEDLAGQRITVVGTTDQVSGEIGVDFTTPGNSELGIIQVNASTLATDSNFRNRAIRNRILNTDEFEFITFTPSVLNGMPDTVAVGDTVTFTVDGELTVRDVTNLQTFTVELIIVSDGEISGSAATVITQEAYGINIPSVPNVANVEEEIELYIDFSAASG